MKKFVMPILNALQVCGCIQIWRKIMLSGLKENGLTKLSGNALKIIAAAFMAVDHIGFLFFPRIKILRILGRLAFPIFAFMIAEGCRYTKNRLRHFLSIFLLAVLCQTVYYFALRDTGMSILVTFSLSILMIYGLQHCKKALSNPALGWLRQSGAVLLFLLLVAAVYLLNQWLTIDYGYWGCMVPVFASLFQQRGGEKTKFYGNTVHVAMLGLGLIPLALTLGGIQFYSFLALPLLLLYSGKRGNWNMKYFFYVFYPAHLVVLQGIYLLLH